MHTCGAGGRQAQRVSWGSVFWVYSEERAMGFARGKALSLEGNKGSRVTPRAARALEGRRWELEQQKSENACGDRVSLRGLLNTL